MTCLEAHISPKAREDVSSDLVQRLAEMKSKLETKINFALGKASQQVSKIIFSRVQLRSGEDLFQIIDKIPPFESRKYMVI